MNWLRTQLQDPDPVGRDVTLLRTRLYRFSDDPRWYVLAETLEENFLAGRAPLPATLAEVRACLAQIRNTGQPMPFRGDIAEREGIDINAGLQARIEFSWRNVPLTPKPVLVVVILGAPRSGTSHLFNLLAKTGQFAYFTTASCWAWPVRNLHYPQRRPFTEFGDEIFAVDNKRTRLIPGLVMPGEAEDIWHRATPVYEHIKGHRYQIKPAATGEVAILHAAAQAHLAYFGKDQLLVKSPFNCFRIPQIEQQRGDRVRYVHIVRDQGEAADSMRRNHFEFMHDDQLLDAEDAWSLFVDAVRDHAPKDRTVTIRHEMLLNDPSKALTEVSAAYDRSSVLSVSEVPVPDSVWRLLFGVSV